jgi:DNA-binding Xre family transcriptional regulator
MLHYKLNELLLASGIENPLKWLRKSGFSITKARGLLTDTQKTITTKDISKLCYLLYCTPNDLWYWKPTPKFTLPENHPIHTALHPAPQHANWHTLVNQVSKAEAIALHAELAQKIKEMKEK